MNEARQIVLIGAAFNSDKRNLDSWTIETFS